MASSDDQTTELLRTQRQAIERVLERSPDASVGALRRDGLLTALPDSLVLGPSHQKLESRSVIDLVSTESTAAVVSAWERVRSFGQAECRARLRSDPSVRVRIEFFDVATAFEVYIVLITLSEESEPAPEAPSFISSPSTPRIGRVRKSFAAMVVDADDATLRMLGFLAGEMVGRRSLDLIHPDDQATAIDNWLEMLSSPEQTQRVRLRHLQGDGSYRWVEISNENRLGEDGEGDVVTEMVDISEEMAMLEMLREREQLLSRLAEALPLALLHFDLTGSIVYSNERVAELTGVSGVADLWSQLAQVVPDDRSRLLAAANETLATGAPAATEVHLELGERAWVCDVRLRAIEGLDAEVTGAIMCISDVTESVLLRRELQERATYDFLTGCLNRESAMEELTERLKQPADGVAVVYIDLDAFKAVNDQHGHAMGDAVLVSVADRLRETVRDGDVVGRLGGDEFIVISSGAANNEDAELLAARVAAIIDHEIDCADGTIGIHATVGVAWTDTEANADDLVALADGAMYHRKRGRSVATPEVAAEHPADH